MVNDADFDDLLVILNAEEHEMVMQIIKATSFILIIKFLSGKLQVKR